MKKLMRFTVALALVCACIVPINAQSSTLAKAQSYWLNNNELSGLDAVLAVESLGLDVEDEKNNFTLNYSFEAPTNSYGDEITYEEMDAGYLAKNIMALAAIKSDPAKLKLKDGSTINLIDLLKSKIDENGNVDYGSANPESSTAYTMFALAIVDESYNLDKLGLNLTEMQLSDGSWGYNGAWGGPDITGWALAALSLCNNTYQASIDKALAYLASIQIDNGGYNSAFGVNCNSQACAVWGILEYDIQGVKNGTYNKGTGNPYDLLLQFMQEDGSFGASLDVDYGNAYATVQAALTVGVYENGSLIDNIKAQYDEMLNPKNDQPEPTPAPAPVTPSTPADKSITSVKTGDDAVIALTVSSLIISGGMYLFIRKES